MSFLFVHESCLQKRNYFISIIYKSIIDLILLREGTTFNLKRRVNLSNFNKVPIKHILIKIPQKMRNSQITDYQNQFGDKGYKYTDR